MKLMLCGDTVGGVFTYALELARALHAADDEVVLVTTGGGASADQRARIEKTPLTAWYQRAYALEWMDDPWEDQLATERWLRELIAREAPDVLQLGGFGLAAAGWPIPVVVVAHSDVVSWWRAVHGEDPPGRYGAYRSRVGEGLAAADAVVSPSAAARAALHAAYPVTAERSLVIHNGLGADGSDAVAAKQPFVLGAGRLWDEAKNAAGLAAAGAAFGAGTIRLAGDGRGAAPPGCTMLGELSASELAVQRRRALVFAAPVRYEPFGLAILEAARDACALVLGDIPSLRELWEDAAVFVTPGDDAALAFELRRLLDEPERAAAMGRAGRRRSLRYDAASMASGYQRLYASLGEQAVAA